MRVGIFDIGAAGVVITLLLLPAPERPLEETYTAETGRYAARIAELQANAARHPRSGGAAAELAEVLSWAGQSDWALRAGGAVATADSPDRWRAAWALSKVHAGRFEVEPAYRWAREAVNACAEEGSTCTETDRTFLDMRMLGYQACLESGVDPKVDSKGCFEAVRKYTPQIRAPKPDEPPPPGGTPTPPPGGAPPPPQPPPK